jgi:prophage antirepressor-like protein
MSDTFIDLVNRLLKYNGHDVSIIFDGKNNIWFSASDCATLIGYLKKNVSKTIRKFVSSKYIMRFGELKKYLGKIPHNAQDTALYINQQGLYSFLLLSKKPRATDFFDWIIDSVLASIFSVGHYKEDHKHIEMIKTLNKKLHEQRKEIEQLKFNMKKNKYPFGGYVYAYKKDGYYKTGRSAKLDKRFATYNTSWPNDVKPIHWIEVEDPIATENCIKAALRKYIYRNNKEFYDISLNKLKHLMNQCAKLVKNDFECTICNKKSHNLKKLMKHYTSHDEHTDKEDSLRRLILQKGGMCKYDDTDYGCINYGDLEDDDEYRINDVVEESFKIKHIINTCTNTINTVFNQYKHNKCLYPLRRIPR